MIRILGIVLVIFGAGGFGVAQGVQFYRQLHQLRELTSAMELLKCELNYTLTPLPELCRRVADRVKGAVSSFFRAYAGALTRMSRRDLAAREAFAKTRSLRLPPEAQMALLELMSGLGCYDLEGENRMLQLCAHRLVASCERFQKERRPLAKSYAVLGLCAGVAIVILAV